LTSEDRIQRDTVTTDCGKFVTTPDVTANPWSSAAAVVVALVVAVVVVVVEE